MALESHGAQPPADGVCCLMFFIRCNCVSPFTGKSRQPMNSNCAISCVVPLAGDLMNQWRASKQCKIYAICHASRFRCAHRLMDDFLVLDEVENELTRPDHELTQSLLRLKRATPLKVAVRHLGLARCACPSHFWWNTKVSNVLKCTSTPSTPQTSTKRARCRLIASSIDSGLLQNH